MTNYDFRTAGEAPSLLEHSTSWALKVANSIANVVSDNTHFRDSNKLRFDRVTETREGAMVGIEGRDWGGSVTVDVQGELEVRISVWPIKSRRTRTDELPNLDDLDLNEILETTSRATEAKVKFQARDPYMKVVNESAKAFIKAVSSR